MLRKAVQARSNAYCPYSNFQVGACVLAEDDTYYTGCNVENASYPVGICAERTAYCKAVSEGKKNFKAVAVIAQQKNFFTSPCGACRQFMNEFGDIPVYLAKPDLAEVLVTSLRELLPLSFQTNPDKTLD